MNIPTHIGRIFGVAAALLAVGLPAQAQWLTQSISLKAGWNAVFLHVDASHDTLNAHVAGDIDNPILEVWRWNPPPVAQFTEDPARPTGAPEWTSWLRSNPSSALQRLTGDTAYLVHVGTNVAAYTWTIKGRPVPPRHDWTISGLNLIGFPTVTNNPPRFSAFLAQAPELQSAAPQIYYYAGGDLSSNNPALLPSLLFNNADFGTVKRGQAFWMRSGTLFNRYFGPFEVVQSGSSGVDFHETSGSASLRLRNLTTNNLVITLRLGASEMPPPGQPGIAGLPPLLIRGSVNTTNLTYGYTNLPANSPRTWTLAPRNLPGSEVEVVLGLNRTAISQPAGALLAGILSFTDSLGFTEVDLPVSATAGSSAGLWVGAAAVNQVGQYLVSYARGTVTNYVLLSTSDTNYVAPSLTNTTPVVTTNALLTALSTNVITTTNGTGTNLVVSTVTNISLGYIVTDVNTNLGAVSRAYPLRLIVHNPTNGNAVLLQRVYSGFGAATNPIIASGESALHPNYLSSARRISSTHLPWSATNTAWGLAGRLRQESNFTATVTLPWTDQASNPFLHTYHPDHDNLDVTFKNVLPRGSESYTVERVITLNVLPPENDFSSLVAGGENITGVYLETITIKGLGTSTREFRVSGGFSLTRISQVPTLTLAP